MANDAGPTWALSLLLYVSGKLLGGWAEPLR